jgi:glycosyl transferase family 87
VLPQPSGPGSRSPALGAGAQAGDAGRAGQAGRAEEAGTGSRWARALAWLCTLLLLAATLEIVLDGAVGHSALIPKSPQIAGWLQGIGERLGFRVFLIALLVFTGAYAVLLALAGRSANGRVAGRSSLGWRISPRWAIALVGALQLIVFAGPILFSTDVFSYIDYARMGVLHGIDPYLHGPIAIRGDPVYKYVGSDWLHVATAYGPLYTLLSYPLAPLGLKGALWAMKFEALLASAGTLALTWRCARQRELDPAWALLAVGANPLYVIYGLGGAHNDLIMTCFMMAAVTLAFAGRDAPAGAAVVAGALVKATGAVLLPFMLLARRDWRAVAGAAGALVAVAAVSYPLFGLHGLDVVAALNRDAALVSKDSFPTEIAHLLGKPGVFPVDHDLLKLALVAIVVHLLWRTWRGYDWVAASGWTLLAIAVTSTWLLPWYTLWTLPLAVVARDRRLLIATFAVQGLFIVHQLAPLLSPVS